MGSSFENEAVHYFDFLKSQHQFAGPEFFETAQKVAHVTYSKGKVVVDVYEEFGAIDVDLVLTRDLTQQTQAAHATTTELSQSQTKRYPIVSSWQKLTHQSNRLFASKLEQATEFIKAHPEILAGDVKPFSFWYSLLHRKK